MTTGILLINLGSPNSTETKDVRSYLNQFLMDPYVIDLPYPLRRMIVSLFVLPTRPKESAKAYKAIWQEDGSPLVSISKAFTNELKKQIKTPIELAMRYGNPSIESAVKKLHSEHNVDNIYIFPLYPHYAMSTVTTCIQEVKRVIAKEKLAISTKTHPVFYNNADYIDALYESAKDYLGKPYDHILFSYHGLPERHLTKTDPTKKHCLKTDNCCDVESICHKTCYRHQVFETTKLFASKANLDKEKYSVTFQSRLGKAKWLDPYTDQTIIQLAKQGTKKLLVICPAFVSDCLETLEEIQIQGEEIFKEYGGKELTLIPCLNTHPAWIKTTAKWLKAV